MNVAVPALAPRLAEVRQRVTTAAARSGRAPQAVTIIAVTKTHRAEIVTNALAAGLTDFGENRVQEGVAKAAEIDSSLNADAAGPTWHLIGHLQTNKVRAALNTFAILHSVDSERLLRAISSAATTPTRVFIEVNVAAEPQKYGISVAEVPGIVALGRSLENIEVLGLMTVAPHTDNPERARPVFRTLRLLAEAEGLSGLSMGMSNDYEVAIEEGATHVRIGRALFGDRS